jgi:hypothetical protein
MLTPEETTQFLQNSQNLSNEMAAHVQFIKETFLPQMDTFNGHVAGRLRVPHVSRETVTTFMQGSAHLPTYTPKIVGENNNARPVVLPVHQAIETKAILTCMFPGDMLQNVFGPDRDFALYFDAAYKSLIMYPGAGDHYNLYKAYPIFTNYDFYVEIAIVQGQYSEMTRSENGQGWSSNPVPLSGSKLRRGQVSLKFVALGAPSASSAQELLNPGEKELRKFLSNRKPFIHPVIILDYVRAQPLPDIMAFFGDVSAYELAAAKNAHKSEAAAHARTAVELATLKSARSADAAAMREMQAALQAAAQHAQEHRTKQNDDALRVKRLQLKLSQTEKLYEDLHLRLIEQEDSMDDPVSLSTDATTRP